MHKEVVAAVVLKNCHGLIEPQPPRPRHMTVQLYGRTRTTVHCPNQMNELKLWCYLEGDRLYFSVLISPSETIDDLKKLIYKAKEKSFGCNAVDLILKKVRY